MSSNHLQYETSPYLLQHKDNPVHWWAWGTDALAEARRLHKPILLSVGYAACHWCHVMAHESFEDEATAALMNNLFVNIKVDREERPDIDALYMDALHMMGEQGGWPLTMFLTPKGEPFWGGTYFPKKPSYGRPSFQTILKEIARIYKEEPKTVLNNSDVITKHLKQHSSFLVNSADDGDSVILNSSQLREFANKLYDIVDLKWGGTQGAPKFPQVGLFEFLWRKGLHLNNTDFQGSVRLSLRNMCQGGIYDHLGGGFARYSVDDKWLVPHFEKMLYDNALLLDLMCEVSRETEDPLLKQRIFETAEWVLREMIAEGGGFAASLDADSEGVEGKFYVWDRDEVIAVLRDRGMGDMVEPFCKIYDVQENGNWDGKTILNRLEAIDYFGEDGAMEGGEDMEMDLQKCRNILLNARTHRIRPSWDDKVLSDWNGLMITSLAKAGEIFAQTHWIAASITAFDFVVTQMMEVGRLYHSYRAGQAKVSAISSDYANMIGAALCLYQITTEEKYLDYAKDWADILDQYYWDHDEGGYFLIAQDTNDVLIRQKSARDDATPSANGVMVSELSKLFVLTGEMSYKDRAEKLAQVFSSSAGDNLFAHTKFFSGILDLSSLIHVVISGQNKEGRDAFVKAFYDVSLPGAVLQVVPDASVLPEHSPAKPKAITSDGVVAYICVGALCLEPATDLADFRGRLLLARGDRLTNI
ncbi:MAG: thioredoxin domain-containing protein [Pseudomonadota bacterium]